MNVEYFMQQLAENTTPINRNVDFNSKNRSLEKISLNYEGNFGMYQILPFESVVQDIPFITLFDTKEICVPRMGKTADGTPNPYKTWIKLLPVTGYKMKDSTGRIVSSLTAEEEDMLNSARTLFDQLYEELDIKNNLQYTKDIARKRNYTIFHAYCINKWEAGDTRTPIRSNFSGLFVCTAKGFQAAVEDSVNSKATMFGGDRQFLHEIYNRNLTGRTGFVLFTIGKNKNAAGYQVNINHECGVKTISSITVPEEDVNLMKDPVANFLGWQAAKEDESVPAEQRRLFNKACIQDAINFMTRQLAAIRAAKQNSTDVNEAIKATNELVLNDLQSQPQTNDPMLQDQAAQGNTPNPDFIKQQNTQPFQTPPAAKMSPITGAPETSNTGFGSGNGFGGFGGNSTPSFTSPFGNFSNGSDATNDLPF